MPLPPLDANVIFVDGTCIACSRIVALILRRDREKRFFISHLQGPFAQDALRRHGADPNDRDGIYLLVRAGTPDEELLKDGAAGREIWPRIMVLGRVMRWIPLPLLNLWYRLFGRYRYRLFGQYASCPIPSPEARARFVDAVPEASTT